MERGCEGFMVLVRGRWRALDLSCGALGGRRARFAVWRRGCVRTLPAGAALRGLRALAAGRPVRLRLGPPLPRRKRGKKRAPAAPPLPAAPLPAAPPPAAPLLAAPPPAAPLPAAPLPVATPPSVSRGVQTTRPTIRSSSSSGESAVSGESATGAELEIPLEDLELLRDWLTEHAALVGLPSFSLYRFDAEERYRERALKHVAPLVRVSRSAVVARMLRVRVRATPPPPPPPPVHRQAVTLQQFTAQLGLQSRASSSSPPAAPRAVRRAAPRAAPSTDSESTSSDSGAFVAVLRRRSGQLSAAGGPPGAMRRQSPERAMRRRSPERAIRRRSPERAMRRRSPERAAPARLPPAPPPAARSRSAGAGAVAGGRPYSSLEDHVIVSWLAAEDARERCVNGNRVWRQLQAEYPRLAGLQRTFHSLRNRYLRYILPSLGELALPPAHARRLRANAALGELKARRLQRDNSLLRQPPPVRSAWALRPRMEPAAPDTPAPAAAPRSATPSPSPAAARRSLRSAGAAPESPEPQAAPRRSLRSAGAAPESPEPQAAPRRSLRSAGAAPESPEPQAAPRRSLRSAGTAPESPEPPEPTRPGRRRLYTPHA